MKKNLTISFLTAVILLVGCIHQDKKLLTKEQILRECANDRKKAYSPETKVNLSKGSKGTRIGLSLSFSSNFIKAIDPNQVYKECLRRLSP